MGMMHDDMMHEARKNTFVSNKWWASLGGPFFTQLISQRRGRRVQLLEFGTMRPAKIHLLISQDLPQSFRKVQLDTLTQTGTAGFLAVSTTAFIT